MLPGRIPNHTHLIGKPADWDESALGHCAALHCRAEIIDGVMYLRSAWVPSPAELQLLNSGASIELGIAGGGHPVVNMGVGNPPPVFGTSVRGVYTITEEVADDGSVWMVTTGRFGDQVFEQRSRIADASLIYGQPEAAIADDIRCMRICAVEAGLLPALPTARG